MTLGSFFIFRGKKIRPGKKAELPRRAIVRVIFPLPGLFYLPPGGARRGMMEGTEKQKEWAEKIKMELLAKLVPYLQQIVSKETQQGTQQEQQENIVNLCEEVLRCNCAKTWIETLRYYTAEEILLKGQKGKSLRDLIFTL